MARRKRRREGSRQEKRDITKSYHSPKRGLIQDRRKRRELTEDRRLWHPDFSPDVMRLDGRPVEYELDTPRRPFVSGVDAKIRFKNPLRTQVCIKRKRRRRVLFALKQAGRGKGGGKSHHRWNENSNIKC